MFFWKKKTDHPLTLVEPSDGYTKQFVKAYRRGHKIRDEGIAADHHSISSGLVQYYERKIAWGGFYPFLLVKADDYIGFIEIRTGSHSDGNIYYFISPYERGNGYGTSILRLGLERCRDIGLPAPELTVRHSNTSSVKVIESNDGVLISQDERWLRYRINLASSSPKHQ